MAWRLIPVRLGLCLLIISPILCENVNQEKQQRETLIQNALKNLLGVKEERGSARDVRTQPLPPTYMMNLYDRFISGQAVIRGNTVRSILPMKGTVGGVDALLFNLTGIHADEQILQSKLYLLKRRRRKKAKAKENSNFRLKITGDVSSANQWVDISLPRRTPEWHSYDITAAVVRCRQAKTDEHLLTVTAEIRRPRGDHRSTTFKRILKPDSQPFVLIFSEDYKQPKGLESKIDREQVNEEIGDLLHDRVDQLGLAGVDLPVNSRHRTERAVLVDQNNIEDRGKLKLLAHQLIGLTSSSTNFSKEDKPASLNEYISLLSNYELTNVNSSDMIKNALKNNSGSSHALEKHFDKLSASFSETKKLTHMDNVSSNSDIDSDSDAETDSASDSESDYAVRTTTLKPSVGDLRTTTYSVDEDNTKRPKRHLSVHTYSTRPKSSENSDSKLNVIDTKIVSEVDNFHPRRKRPPVHKKHRRRKKGRRHRKLPPWWIKHEMKFHGRDFEKMCQRKSLVVDFAEIGWGDWVISPKSFNAYYCDGSCSFPLIKDTKHSNHAVIQSLIHALGTNLNVPSPGCAPSSMNSLTLLYFDQNNGVVLKNYPNMIVEKCACV